MQTAAVRPPGIANWFRRARAPEQGTITLTQRRVYILPTRLGWTYAVTVIILLVGSINYAISLGFVLTFLLAGLGIAGMIHGVRNLAGLEWASGRVEPAFAGESAQFRLHVDNRSAYDRIAVLARHRDSGAQQVFDVPAASSAQAVLDVPTSRRGWCALGGVLVESRFPLGLFRVWSWIEPDVRCLVYPRPIASPLPPVRVSSESGEISTSGAGTEDFSGLREHQYADSPRHVAWKAYARTEDMLTKQFSGGAAGQLWLDWSRLPDSSDIEARLSRLAGWVLAADQAGARYGLRIPGTEIVPANSDSHRTACLIALALFTRPGAAGAP